MDRGINKGSQRIKRDFSRAQLFSNNIIRYTPDGKKLIVVQKESNPTETKKQKDDEEAALFKVLIWNREGGLQLLYSKEFYCSILKAFTDCNGQILIAEGVKNGMKIWHISDEDLAHEFVGGKGYIKDISYDQESNYVASVFSDRTIYIWNMDSGKRISLIKARGCSKFIALIPGGKYILETSDIPYEKYEPIIMWSVPKGRMISSFKGYNKLIMRAPYNSIGEKIISQALQSASEPDSDIGYLPTLDDIDKMYESFSAGVYSAPSVSTDGERVVSAAEDHAVRIWNVSNGDLLIMFDGEDFIHVQFSPNGRYVIATSTHTVCIHDSTSGILVKRFEDISLHFTCSTFSPDGTHCAAVSTEGVVCIWELKSSQEAVKKLCVN